MFYPLLNVHVARISPEAVESSKSVKLTDDMNKENNVGETIKLALKITMKKKEQFVSFFQGGKPNRQHPPAKSILNFY